MTREQTKELLPIMQAFAEGKTIQYYYTTPTPHWEDVLPNQTVDFNSDASKYRIKPEPKYRPFKNQNECWEEMLKTILIIIIFLNKYSDIIILKKKK